MSPQQAQVLIPAQNLDQVAGWIAENITYNKAAPLLQLLSSGKVVQMGEVTPPAPSPAAPEGGEQPNKDAAANT